MYFKQPIIIQCRLLSDFYFRLKNSCCSCKLLFPSACTSADRAGGSCWACPTLWGWHRQLGNSGCRPAGSRGRHVLRSQFHFLHGWQRSTQLSASLTLLSVVLKSCLPPFSCLWCLDHPSAVQLPFLAALWRAPVWTAQWWHIYVSVYVSNVRGSKRLNAARSGSDDSCQSSLPATSVGQRRLSSEQLQGERSEGGRSTLHLQNRRCRSSPRPAFGPPFKAAAYPRTWPGFILTVGGIKLCLF